MQDYSTLHSLVGPYSSFTLLDRQLDRKVMEDAKEDVGSGIAPADGLGKEDASVQLIPQQEKPVGH